MAIKSYKPTSPGRRFYSVSTFEDIDKKAKPEKSLLVRLKNTAGRNSQGRVTTRHRGGGHRRMYRIIDWKRDKDGVPAKVAQIEYDPNRSARIALLHYVDGEKRYIICPMNLAVGDRVVSGKDADIKVGNALPLRNIPVGTVVHNLELKPGQGAQIVRTAGSGAQLMAKEGKNAHVRLPSREVRLFSLDCKAVIGQVSNFEHEGISVGKAGRNRWRGKRPTVRGVAMNPCDHPHGGGEARSTTGRPSTTPWGKPALGYRTRKNKKTDMYIVKKRTKK